MVQGGGQFVFVGHEEAQRAFLANVSPRYLKLEGFEKWLEKRQYEGLPNFWDDSVPLWERAPVIVRPTVANAAASYVDLVLGEGRFPTFTTKPAEGSDPEDGDISPEEADVLDNFIREYHRMCRFRAAARSVLYDAQGCGTSVVIHGVRNGKPVADVVPAKWCEPKLGQDGEVLELEIRYPYFEQYRQPDGKWAVRAKIYRRVIDATSDTEFHPADAREDGAQPSWRKNPERSVEHNLGFCPVVWYPFMRGCQPVNVIDGEPIHKGITDELRQYDIARSQWHRGALLSEPQIVEIGVSPGFSPTEVGNAPIVVSTEHGGDPSPANKVTGGYVAGPARKTARKKGPGYPWQYPSPETKVNQLTYPGDALKAQQDNCKDLLLIIQEALAIIFLDPENIKFAATTSGKALEAIKERQLDRCDQIRDDIADHFLEPSISMQLRIAERVLSRGQALRVRGARKVLPILKRLAGTEGTAEAQATNWRMPALHIEWGRYFKPDPEEERKIVTLVLDAFSTDTPLITLKLALQKIAPVFGIENVSALEAELEQQAQKRAERARAGRVAEQQELHELARSLTDAGTDRGRA